MLGDRLAEWLGREGEGADPVAFEPVARELVSGFADRELREARAEPER